MSGSCACVFPRLSPFRYSSPDFFNLGQLRLARESDYFWFYDKTALRWMINHKKSLLVISAVFNKVPKVIRVFLGLALQHCDQLAKFASISERNKTCNIWIVNRFLIFTL